MNRDDVKEGEWLPIEAAPKDGSTIVLKKGDEQAEGFWRDGWWRVWEAGYWGGMELQYWSSDAPTHWMTPVGRGES